MYLSEGKRKGLTYIVNLEAELGHLPNFKEFDEHPNTPRANSLAHEFGSYSAALEMAKYYVKHPELLQPPEPAPSPSPTKRKSKAKQTTKKSTSTVITPDKKQDTLKKYSYNWKQTSAPPKPAPEPPKKASEPPKAPELKNNPAPAPKPQKTQILPPRNINRPLLVNYYPQVIALISGDHYLSHAYDEPTEKYPYMIIQRSDYVAKTDVRTIATYQANSYHAVTTQITFDVPILQVTKRPVISRNSHDSDLPAPKTDTILIVPYEVAIAARESGRTTEDLAFPATFYEQDNICWCAELGKV